MKNKKIKIVTIQDLEDFDGEFVWKVISKVLEKDVRNLDLLADVLIDANMVKYLEAEIL